MFCYLSKEDLKNDCNHRGFFWHFDLNSINTPMLRIGIVLDISANFVQKGLILTVAVLLTWKFDLGNSDTQTQIKKKDVKAN